MANAPAAPQIPTYRADGRRLRAYSPDAIEHLLSLSLVVVRRNRRGTIVCAHFRPTDGANPLRNSAHMGQKYSVLENVGESGARAWRHRSLIQKQDIEQLTGVPLDTPAELDMYLRSIFRGVALSCMRPDDPPPAAAAPRPAKAKVIPIKRLRSNRPVEFDSEGRKVA